MKRRPRKPISYKPFWREVTQDGRRQCQLRNATPGFKCGGPLDAHHYIPKRRIDSKLGGKYAVGAIAAKIDSRNGIPLCRRHHDLVERGDIKSPRPPFLAYFLQDHGLTEREPLKRLPRAS